MIGAARRGATGTPPDWEVVVPAGAELGERPVWDAARRCLIWVDILAGELHEYHPPTAGQARADKDVRVTAPAATVTRTRSRPDRAASSASAVTGEAGGTDGAKVAREAAAGAKVAREAAAGAGPGTGGARPGTGGAKVAREAAGGAGPGTDRVLASVGVPVGAAAPRRGGGYVLAAADGFRLLRADGSADGPPLRPAGMGDDVRFNDGACDPAGRFWAGTATLDGSPGGGALYRLEPDGSVTKALGGVTESNGLGWSPDQRAFYYIDSAAERLTVRKYAYDTLSGKISAESELIAFGPADGVPDGLVVDTDGCLWIAFWDGGCVRRYSPAGELLAIWPTPVSRPTCPGFGGAGLDQLYLTTAWEGLDQRRRDAEPLAGHLMRAPAGVRGLALTPYGG